MESCLNKSCFEVLTWFEWKYNFLYIGYSSIMAECNAGLGQTRRLVSECGEWSHFALSCAKCNSRTLRNSYRNSLRRISGRKQQIYELSHSYDDASEHDNLCKLFTLSRRLQKWLTSVNSCRCKLLSRLCKIKDIIWLNFACNHVTDEMW